MNNNYYDIVERLGNNGIHHHNLGHMQIPIWPTVFKEACMACKEGESI